MTEALHVWDIDEPSLARADIPSPGIAAPDQRYGTPDNTKTEMPRGDELSDLRTYLPPLNNAIARLCRAKRRYGFDLDDIIIIAACGAINFAGAKHKIPFAQPANIASIAGYIRMSRETVRRKLQCIEDKGFVHRYSGGYLVKNLGEWLELVGQLAPRQGA